MTPDRHLADSVPVDDTAVDADVVDVHDFGGGTMSHYLPNEPRKPAPTGEAAPLRRPATPEPLPPPPVDEIPRHPPSIAELFQSMLRTAYQAGAASASTGESFETWYEREVLQ